MNSTHTFPEIKKENAISPSMGFGCLYGFHSSQPLNFAPIPQMV
jgi:hypothetical protein